MNRKAVSEDKKLLRWLVKGTAAKTGLPFFKSLVKGLTEALGTHGAWVTEYLPDQQRLRSIAFRLGDRWVPEYEYDVGGTPCEVALETKELLLVADRVADLFPSDRDLRPFGAVSYIGTPLFDERRSTVLGHLAVLDTKPIRDPGRYGDIFQVFANRAGAELQRLNLERELRETNSELKSIVDSAVDAIVIVTGNRQIVRANRAAEGLFRTPPREGANLDACLGKAGAKELRSLLARLGETETHQRARSWIAAMEVIGSGGEKAVVEGTVSKFKVGDRLLFTLILRNINDRLAAEHTLQSLQRQTAYLREELDGRFGDIVGNSPAIRRVIQDVLEVAATDATVLITGETGTGKELVARAIHRESARKNFPLVRVNCPAIPAPLIESELFGHEKGAFTGATARREGRFLLADKGTIFLDEIGELSLDLQSKLLRVLQEGEFEPVGSSTSHRVNVRVIAATNRDLRREVEAGRFREDLYYRLSVFPMHLPPLRARENDIELLARAFAADFARRYGKQPVEFSVRDAEKLRAYRWPGNVRELSNVIERALITGGGSALNLDRALPEPTADSGPAADTTTLTCAAPQILTIKEMDALSRQNLIRALESCRWQVAGPNGAARLLGIPPSTLNSRLKLLGLTRPR